MTKFTMMVGISGSGKSTMARDLLSQGFYDIMVSSDDIREEIWGDASIQNRPDIIFNIAHERIIEALKDGKDVIFDATNLKVKDRKNLLDKISNIPNVENTCIIVYPHLEWCIENQDKRDRKVPEEVIRKQFKNFQLPTSDEGWDYILITDHVVNERLYPEVESGYYIGMGKVD